MRYPTNRKIREGGGVSGVGPQALPGGWKRAQNRARRRKMGEEILPTGWKTDL